jgi:hypothetical protein
MADFAVRDLLRSNNWSRLFFTTYALSVSFFEAVVLDAIVRQQVDSALILADEAGVRSAMNEFGAQGVGRSYDLEPVVVTGGCFHPKLISLVSPDEAHLVVGSGNLTFGGWGSNLECAEHLHPSFAPTAFLDAAEFLRELATSPRIRHAASESCFELAEDLSRRGDAASSRNPSIRLVHNLERSIPDQLASAAADLGGAQQLTIVSPFFDRDGVSIICRALGLSHASIHSHPAGFVLGTAGARWPSGASLSKSRAVEVEQIAPDSRRLHGKLFEVVCRHGRLIMSGSSNATGAGLEAERNVELCVLRIQKEPSIRWTMRPAQPPVVISIADDESESTKKAFAILRATVSGGTLVGQILNSFPEGPADILSRTALRWSSLGQTSVRSDGRFSLRLKDSWSIGNSGQFLVRVESNSGPVAQGFAALPEVREIARRLGRSAQHFFSLLQGREDAADVTAILEYIRIHPEFLPEVPAQHSGGSSEKEEREELVDVARTFGGNQSRPQDAHDSRHSGGVSNFMHSVLAAFRERRGPIDPGSGKRNGGVNNDEENEPEGESPEEVAEQTAVATKALDLLLERLIDVPEEDRQPIRAVDITQYVCERLKLEAYLVRAYIERLVRAFVPPIASVENQNVYSGLALLSAGQLNGTSEMRARSLRRLILRMGLDLGAEPPLSVRLGGFEPLLPYSENLGLLWALAKECRTAQEEMKLFWESPTPLDRDDLPLLSDTSYWELLTEGRSSRAVVRMRRYVEYCPHCSIKLSSVEASRLKAFGIGRCNYGKLILCEEF